MIPLARFKTLRALSSLLYPPVCTICYANVGANEYLCEDCRNKVTPITPPFCATCSEPFEGAITGSFTKKDGRARFTGSFNRRRVNNRCNAERVRPYFKKGRRYLGSRRYRGTRLTFMAIFKKPVLKAQSRKKRDIPHGLFQKCLGCSEVVHEIELAQNQRVCPRCDYHLTQSAKERIDNLLDPESFVEMDAGLNSIDTLRFQGMATYKDRLKNYQERTGLTDAVSSDYGLIDGYKVALAVMDFGFLAATMGSVVGERITRTIEYGTDQRAAVVIVSAPGS